MPAYRLRYQLCAVFLLLKLIAAAQPVASYLNQHKVVFQADDSTAYQLFDTAFYQSDVFMLGEVHGYAAPQMMDLALLKHLNQRVGLRYYLAEMDGAKADLVNQYLKTGQKATLDSVFTGFLKQTHEGTSQWGNQQFYDKLVALRAYNQTRPDSLRVQLLGVDWFQSDGRYALTQLSQLVNRQPYPVGTCPELDSLVQVTNQQKLTIGKLLPFAKAIQADLLAKKGLYQQWLGSQKTAFAQIIETLSLYKDGIRSRDEIAARLTQFLVADMGLRGEKLYGLWGYTHVFRGGVNDQPTLSGLLAAAGHRVITIPVLFSDSDMLLHRKYLPFIFRKEGEFQQTQLLNADGRVSGVDGFDELKAVSGANQITLFRLDAPGSPYKTTLKLVKMGGITGSKMKPNHPESQVTTDFFQYVFVVRNSPALTLWAPMP